ncbi:MAG: preprotein translocase subunit SecE [Janthinobacterium lividum]
MAKSYDNDTNSNNAAPAGTKKAASAKPPVAPANARLSDVQRRAQQMANKPQTSPAQFFQEAWVELKKTSWPNRAVLTKSTSVVLALVVAVAIWVGGIDAVLTALFPAGR